MTSDGEDETDPEILIPIPPPPPSSRSRRKGGSGEHPAVKAFRDKMDSIAEGTMNIVLDLNERIERLRVRSDRPPSDPSLAKPRRDPRREAPSSDLRHDSGIPVDVVEGLDRESDPFPPPPSSRKGGG